MASKVGKIRQVTGAVVDTSLGVHPYPSPRYATQVVFSDLVAQGDVVPAEQAPLERLTRDLEHTHGCLLYTSDAADE